MSIDKKYFTLNFWKKYSLWLVLLLLQIISLILSSLKCPQGLTLVLSIVVILFAMFMTIVSSEKAEKEAKQNSKDIKNLESTTENIQKDIEKATSWDEF